MMRFLVAIKQALTATGRSPNSGARSDQSLLQKAETSHNVSQYQSFDTPNTPDTWGSDPGAFSELRLKLKPRQADITTTHYSTCGYLNGNASLPRTANSGYDCRVDTKNAIWGFCSTAILAVSDCGFVGGCVDTHACDSGCGNSGDPGVTTSTCSDSGAEYCSTALLTEGPDQTYSYIACGRAAITDNLLNSPTSTSLYSSTSTTSPLSRAKPSVTSASSTSSATSSSPVSTKSIISIISSAPASSSAISKATPGPSNNTGAIVGGVLGGLALLTFVIVAILFHRRLKTRPTNGTRNYDPVLQDVGFERGVPKIAPTQRLHPAELLSHNPPAELSSGRHDEMTELPNNIGRTRRT